MYLFLNIPKLSMYIHIHTNFSLYFFPPSNVTNAAYFQPVQRYCPFYYFCNILYATEQEESTILWIMNGSSGTPEKDQNYQIINETYKVIINQKDWVCNQW